MAKNITAKLFRVALFLCALLVVSPLAEAQKRKKNKKEKRKKKKGKKDKVGKGGLTKRETKEWKKRLKKLEPAQYKVLMDEYYNLKEQVSQSESSMSEYEAQIGEQEKALGKYKQEMAELRKRLAEKPKTVASATDAFAKGVVFRIQIGAYEGINLAQYSNQKNFKVENNGSVQKFTIGAFREYRDADGLKRYLQRMGVSDAWIVAYRDGQRVEMSSVTGGG